MSNLGERKEGGGGPSWKKAFSNWLRPESRRGEGFKLGRLVSLTKSSWYKWICCMQNRMVTMKLYPVFEHLKGWIFHKKNPFLLLIESSCNDYFYNQCQQTTSVINDRRLLTNQCFAINGQISGRTIAVKPISPDVTGFGRNRIRSQEKYKSTN